LNVTLIYGAVTRGAGTSGSAAEWRAFTVRYVDHRDVAKVDNRLAAVRSRDLAEIDVSTFGGHYLATRQTAGGPVDLLLWGAVQRGSWGELRHRAGALSIEGGWQPRLALAPWLRGGWNYGSGDGNAADGTHATFFQLLPTPRVYARLPFFNMMNTSDAFGEIVLRPGAITIRGDVHDIRLANRNDLWYQGGGAFQPATFGYAGRPSNGSTSLATLYDVSADVSVSPNVGVVAYLGYAAGRRVTDAIYGGGGTRLGYAELTLRF
jgi:hypothetical protein